MQATVKNNEKREKDTKVKFATQADAAVLEALRTMATNESRHIQALVDEALREYLERKQGTRKHVVQACKSSMIKYDSLYTKLAQ